MNYRLIIICVLIIASCSRKNEKMDIRSFSFVPKEEVNFQIDSLTTHYWFYSEPVVIDGKKYIAHQNHVRSNPEYIYFKSLEDNGVNLKVDLKQEGPNGIGQLWGFHYVNMDSIFTLDRYSYTVNLIDTSGVVKRRYRLIDQEKNEPTENSTLPWAWNKARMFMHNNILYIPALPDRNPFHSEYRKKQLLIALDVKTGAYEYLLNYPSKYRNGGYWGNSDHILPSISFIYNTDEVVVSYPIDDSVYIYNLNSKKLRAMGVAKSSLVNSLTALSSYTSERTTNLKFRFGTDQYNTIIYDQYRNCYYRFCSEKHSDESINNMISYKRGKPQQQSIMVFDKKLNMTQEYLLEKGVYNIDGSFVTEKGLYIEKINESEDIKEFEVFDFYQK